MITNLAPPRRSRLEIVLGTLAVGSGSIGGSFRFTPSAIAYPRPSSTHLVVLSYRRVEETVNGYVAQLYEFQTDVLIAHTRSGARSIHPTSTLRCRRLSSSFVRGGRVSATRPSVLDRGRTN